MPKHTVWVSNSEVAIVRFENKNGYPILSCMVNTIKANKALLSDVDGLIGDGDHGANMNKGFSMFGERFAEDVDLSHGLVLLGNVLMNEIGGSMGPIYGTLFSEMGFACEGLTWIDELAFSEMLHAGLNALMQVVDARVGDKTLMDSLIPAIKSFDDCLSKGLSFKDALEAMRSASILGRDSTKDLQAKYGRSARLGKRSIGVLDAGAVSCCLLIGAICDGVETLLT